MLLESLLESLQTGFSKRQKTLEKELKWRGIPKEIALSLYLNDFIHKSKHYTPKEIQENASFDDLISYFKNLKYAHCGQKPLALAYLLEHFKIPSRRISYTDIKGWAHGFLEVFADGKWRILDPTFNMYFDIGTNDIIENPYCARKILSLFSNEFYTDSTQDYDDFYKTQIDSNSHTTLKYNREWFMFMGFYPFVAPILTFSETLNGESKALYDIREDKRYELVRYG